MVDTLKQKARNPFKLYGMCLIMTGLCMFLAACTFLKPKPPTGTVAVAKSAPLPGESVMPIPSTLFPEPKYGDKSGTFVRMPERYRKALSNRLDVASQGLGSWKKLEKPVRLSLEYVRKMDQKAYAVTRSDIRLTWGQVRRSLEDFLKVLPKLDKHPELLGRGFVWFGLAPKPIMTGYYTPEIKASLTKRPGYQYPIYGVPKDLKVERISQTKVRYYRLVNGRKVPYYDRRALDVEKVLKGRGCEIAWAQSPLDIFYLQVEGGGRLRLPDGSVRNLLYGAKNGHNFKGLGSILCDRGLLPRHKRGKKHVYEYLTKRPKNMYEYMADNRSYVFFRLEDAPPEGAMGKSLTPMVSLATDRELLPLGSVLAFEANIPSAIGRKIHGFRKVTGIGLAQDSGTAIRGHRLDYYVGEGHRVEAVANNIRTKARVYLLISKQALSNG